MMMLLSAVGIYSGDVGLDIGHWKRIVPKRAALTCPPNNATFTLILSLLTPKTSSPS